MKITGITTTKLRYTMDVAMADAIHYMPERPLLIVQVLTDAGLVGMGEAATYGGDLESIEAMVTGEPLRAIVGEDPFEVERLWQRMAMRAHQQGTRGALMMAISGIDVALWDIIGQATRTPLYRLLGGYRDTLTAYASAGFYARDKDARTLADEAASYVDRGFEWIKIKVGRNPDVMQNPPQHDRAGLRDSHAGRGCRARAGCARRSGPTRIAIDANNAWTPPVALRSCGKWSRLTLAGGAGGDRGSQGQRGGVQNPGHTVSGYETETGLAGFRDLILAQAVDIVQPDVIWTGGITPCRKIAAFAEAFSLPVVPHVFSSGLSTIANMHFIASIPNGGLLECDQIQTRCARSCSRSRSRSDRMEQCDCPPSRDLACC